jgi:hypothetical protein
MATALLWLAFVASLVGILVSWAPAGARVGRVPWTAVAWALFFASLLVAGGHLDLDL